MKPLRGAIRTGVNRREPSVPLDETVENEPLSEGLHPGEQTIYVWVPGKSL